MRPKHPDKEVERAVKYAESQGWHYVKPGKSSHAWGRLLCNKGHRECHMSVWSTPKNPENFAKGLYKKVNRCN